MYSFPNTIYNEISTKMVKIKVFINLDTSQNLPII